MKTILVLLFLAFNHLGFAQLIDPFGKIVTHEIKLEKLKDGTYAGAMEWITGGADSLQKFIIKGLDIKSPVMVRIISKAPDHNIDLSFHKKSWNKVESKISTDGDKFVEKTFRTMNSAGIGVQSDVAGIPYLISVKVGLQFPSTRSLIRITDNKEEYEQHMRKMGVSGQIFSDNDNNNSNSNTATSTNSGDGNSTLTYIIIGLLTIIIILLALFLLKKKSTKNTMLLLIVLFSGPFCIAQTGVPKLVPVDGQGNSPVFYEYSTSNVTNQNTVPVTEVMNVQEVEIEVPLEETGTFIGTRNVRIETAPGSVELSEEEAAEIQRRIEESDREFDDNYGEDSPGEETEGGDARTLPNDRTQEELEQLRREVRRLRNRVDELTPDDEELDEDGEGGDEIVLYCEQIENCFACIQNGLDKFGIHMVYFQFLQDFYSSEITSINTQIEYGNSIASIPGAGLGWGPILKNRVMPAVNNLKQTYSRVFDDYIKLMEADIELVRACYSGENAAFPSQVGYDIQLDATMKTLKASKIIK